MRTLKTYLLFLHLSCAICSVQGQGNFRNLDFELARFTLTPTPPGGFGGYVPITNGIPLWRGYVGNSLVTEVLQNDITLGDANISIFGPNWSFGGIIEGEYSVVLQAGQNPISGIPGDFVGATISQVGLVPVTAQSLQMKANGSSFLVTFAGQDISLSPIFAGPNHTLYGGDISRFAGQSGELRITALSTSRDPHNSPVFDSIIFSSQSVPEPSVLALSAVGVLLLFWRARKPRRRSSASMRRL